jgi:hypothetical protein
MDSTAKGLADGRWQLASIFGYFSNQVVANAQPESGLEGFIITTWTNNSYSNKPTDR